MTAAAKKKVTKKKTSKKSSNKPRVVKAEIDESSIPSEKKKTGPKPITLSDEEIKKIEVMAGLGLKMIDISSIMGFSRRVLTNIANRDDRVREAIDTGRAKAASQVAQTAFQLAKGGKHPAMTMFWLKCRQRWREVHPEDQKQHHEVVFKTKIGDKGQLLQEQKNIGGDDDDDY